MPRMRSHQIETRETESFRRFVAANGGNVMVEFPENRRETTIAWTEDDDNRVDVSDFPQWRMI